MAVTTVTTKMVAGVKYTVQTDSNVDWGGVSNSTYFYDLTDEVVYYKDGNGVINTPYTTITGGTYSSGTLTLDNNDGNSISVSGFTSGGSSLWTDKGDSGNGINYDSGDPNQNYVEINSGTGGNLNTFNADQYRFGSLFVGQNNTFGTAGAGSNYIQSSVGIGTQQVWGGLGTVSYGFSLGAGNEMRDGLGSFITGTNNDNSGNYNALIGQSVIIYGNDSKGIGKGISIGTATVDKDENIGIGADMQLRGANRTAVIGFGVDTNFTTDQNTVHFGAHTGNGTRSSMGIFCDPGISSLQKPVNLSMGSINCMRSGAAYPLQSGVGNGILYISNGGEAPTVNAPNAVGLFGSDRTGGFSGLLIKGENGGKSWIGDRIGINVDYTSPNPTLTTSIDASLHIRGEGNTDGTSSLKIEDNGTNTLFEVKDDGTVVIPNIGSTTSVTNLGIDSSGNVVSGSTGPDSITFDIFNTSPASPDPYTLYDDGNIRLLFDEATTDDIEILVLTDPAGSVQVVWSEPTAGTSGSVNVNTTSGQVPLNTEVTANNVVDIVIWAPSDSLYPYYEVKVTVSNSSYTSIPAVARVSKWNSPS